MRTLLLFFILLFFHATNTRTLERYFLFDFTRDLSQDAYIYYWIEMSFFLNHLNEFYNDCFLETCFKNVLVLPSFPLDGESTLSFSQVFNWENYPVQSKLLFLF